MRTLTEKAIEFAQKKHKGQLEDSGKSYFEAHLMVVYDLLKCITNDEEVLCAGLLHDTLEDTETTLEELKRIFGHRIANLVYEVTHEGKADEKGFYFPRLKSKEAIIVKMADRISNLSRMESWDEKRQEHYLKNSKFWRSG